MHVFMDDLSAGLRYMTHPIFGAGIDLSIHSSMDTFIHPHIQSEALSKENYTLCEALGFVHRRREHQAPRRHQKHRL